MMSAQRNLCQRVAMRLMNANLVACFQLWYESTIEAKEQLEMMRRVGARILNTSLSGAFYTWREFAEEMIDQALLLRRAGSKLLNHQLSIFFCLWRNVTQEARQEQGRMKRTVMRLLNQQMVMAYTLWKNLSVSLKRQQMLAQRVTMRLLSQKQTLALSHWRLIAGMQAAEARNAQLVAQRCMQTKKSLRAQSPARSHDAACRRGWSWPAGTRWVRARGMPALPQGTVPAPVTCSCRLRALPTGCGESLSFLSVAQHATSARIPAIQHRKRRKRRSAITPRDGPEGAWAVVARAWPPKIHCARRTSSTLAM